MRNLCYAFLVLALAYPTSSFCFGQDDSSVAKYCAEHFTGGVAMRPRKALQSKVGRDILQATFGIELDVNLAKLKAVLGIDPHLLPEVAFFLDDELAGNIEKRHHPESVYRQQQILERIGFAFHGFHDVHGSFPDDDGHRRTSKGKLSWRVHLLPVFGYADVYRKFRLNEPWDSPHNKQLINKMPDCYELPGLKTEPGKTCIHVFTGKGALFHGDVHPSLRDITDGRGSATLAVISGPNRAAIWTKPGGLDFDPKTPMDALGDFGEATLFLTAAEPTSNFDVDVSVPISRDSKPETVASLIGHADGETMGPLLSSDVARPVGRPAIVATTVDDITQQDQAVCPTDATHHVRKRFRGRRRERVGEH